MEQKLDAEVVGRSVQPSKALKIFGVDLNSPRSYVRDLFFFKEKENTKNIRIKGIKQIKRTKRTK